MVGGGIFTVLGISVEMVGAFTPIAILLGGFLALLAAYSYVQLALYYQDEGATYSFFKRTFPKSSFAASLIGWWVVFGYIATVALYAYTFSAYAVSAFEVENSEWARKIVAGLVILLFALVNIWSVRGMGKIEDVLVYSKLAILLVIAFVLINNNQTSLPVLFNEAPKSNLLSILIVASITFVAYEGFQLVIHAINDMENPVKSIPKAIYTAIFLATGIYVVKSVGAILTIPFADIIQNKEYALAAGAEKLLGHWGTDLVVLGALLATSSAISGTLFGASRLVAVIAKDGYFPKFLSQKKAKIPVKAVIGMSLCSFSLVLLGGLELILEFGSVTFLIVSLLMAYANFTIRDKTGSSPLVTVIAISGLCMGTLLIFYYELTQQPLQLVFIAMFCGGLTLGAWFYSRFQIR
jgi:amino acid transporter